MEWTRALDGWGYSMRSASRSAQTIKLRRYHLERMAGDLGRPDPWAVTGQQLVQWAGSQDWSPETRRSVRSSVRGFYAWGVGMGHLVRSPADALFPVRPTPPRPRPAGDRAIRLSMATAEPRVRLMIRLGAELGMRRGEVARVHSRDLVPDLAGWSLVVHGKGNRDRLVPMTDELASSLRDWCPEGWAFPGDDGGHLSPAWVGKLVSRALPEGVTMHQLRHRFGTAAYAVDRDLLTVQRLLGHASPATTQRYVLTPDTAARATVRSVSVA